MTTVAVVGSTGQLGTDVVTTLRDAGSYNVIPLSHAAVECTDLTSVRAALGAAHPDVVINCAAFVRVDDCEDRREDAFKVNALGAFHVAQVCAELDALCVYVSTDYVFDGDKSAPYGEDDEPRPINMYGASKLAGERLVQVTTPKWLIIRTASLFGTTGARGKNGNFVNTIVTKARNGEALRVVNDVRMSPTYARDAARGLERLLQHNTTGLVHLTNRGSCTWYEFARAILDLLRLDTKLESVPSKEYQTKARRPRDSSLRSTRLSGLLGEDLRPWQDALDAYLHDKGHIVAAPARLVHQ